MRRLVNTAVYAGLFAAVLAAPAVHAQTKNPLMGAWKVTEIANPGRPPLTEPQPGLYIFTERYYSAVRLNGTTPLPAYTSNEAATDAEKAAAFNILYTNTGSYTVNGNSLVLNPMVAKSAFAMAPGRSLAYEFTVQGDTLTLVQKPSGPGLKFVRVE